jgi:hypothetical protein
MGHESLLTLWCLNNTHNREARLSFVNNVFANYT